MYEENTTGTALYIYGPTGRLAKRTTINNESSTFYYHADHQGSTRLVTDESKSIVTDVQYEPFGEPTVTGEESFLYTGKEKDTIDLYYYGARYYDPETGRFITRDLLAGKKALPQSLNKYTYCLNNPVKYIDPAGLTYRMCDVNTGVCYRYYERYNPNGPAWTAYNAKGEKITDSNEMDKLMNSDDPADQAKAVYLMLLMTHPEIEGDPSQMGTIMDEGGYRFEVTIEGEKAYIWVSIVDADESEGGHYADTFLMAWEEEDGSFVDMVHLIVYQATFQSIAYLYHVIGHEGVHIYENVSIGTTYEYSAWMWNLKHIYYPFPFPLGRRRLESLIYASLSELPRI